MAVVQVSGIAFSHPGGGELFRDISFRARTGAHVAIVGPNGVGKSTLFGCITGELRPTEGSVHVDGAVALMPQAIGTDVSGGGPVEARASTTVRELLVRFAPTDVRAAGEALAAAEAANHAAPTSETGVALGEAYVVWGEVAGYEHESRWDACCQQVLGQGLDEAGGRPISELSGGERKRLVLESLFTSDVPILLLDEPDNFLDIPGKRWLERRIAASAKTIVFGSTTATSSPRPRRRSSRSRSTVAGPTPARGPPTTRLGGPATRRSATPSPPGRTRSAASSASTRR